MERVVSSTSRPSRRSTDYPCTRRNTNGFFKATVNRSILYVLNNNEEAMGHIYYVLLARVIVCFYLVFFSCGASQYQVQSPLGGSQQGRSKLHAYDITDYTTPKANPCGAIECPPKPTDPKTPPKPIVTPVTPSQPGCTGSGCQGKTGYTTPKVNPCGAIECPPKPTDPKTPPKPAVGPVTPSLPEY
jgi:hypothetical protein